MAALVLRRFAADRLMNETLTKFRNAVSDSTDLQEKVKAEVLTLEVSLGKENAFEFTREELNTDWKELQESDEGLTELEVVAGGQWDKSGGC